MKKIKVNTGREYFAIVQVLGGTYVCPGWTPVPEGTTRDMIELDMNVQSSPQKTSTEVKQEPPKEWRVEASKPGKFYTVSIDTRGWDCTCPAKMFHRGDCKHIKNVKSKKVEKTLV
jgi:hypothetical protein